MAVYLTKNMLSKLRNVTYPVKKNNQEESRIADHWQTLTADTKNVHLAVDMICRVCAKNGCTPLMDKIEDYDIMSAIRMITNVSINADDSLPKYICTDCLAELKTALSFKLRCEASDRSFKKILNPAGDPALHTYPYSKHDFQLILHQMKLKRLKVEEDQRKVYQKQEKLLKKKGPKSKEFKCSPCDIAFPDKEKLAEHRRERQCMRRACDICGQLVVSIPQHMRHIHKKSVSHKCPTCGKEFPIIARLKNHMVVHTNTFNFFCDLCPYKSKHKYYLVMHMRTHTGEKPYQCPSCPATFVNPSNLKKHKLTHQEKQFKCMMCTKAFRTNAALREHHEAAHMNIKHTCSYCFRDFCYKSDLRKHEIRYHNRIKRDYIGGEPTYKQVERMQMEEVKVQDNNDEMEKWRMQQASVSQPVQIVQDAFIVDQHKEFIQSHQSLYFTDVSGAQQQQTTIIQPQTVTILQPEQELSDMTLKKLLDNPSRAIGQYYIFREES